MYTKNPTRPINEIYPLNHIGYTGRNNCIAILDTGIYPHIDLSGRIVCFMDFVSGKLGAYDDNSHGTHVAGIAAGDGTASHGTVYGVAPSCNIAAIKILDKKGNGDKNALIKACDWICRNYEKYNIRIVNISVGSDTADCDEERTQTAAAVEEMWNRGLCVVASAGNSGPGPMTITFPGTCEKVITVGCSECMSLPKEKFYARSFPRPHSGEGPTKCNIVKPDLIAPGQNILSCHNRYNGYTVKSGTSMSTPIVSGCIALYLEKYPYVSNICIKQFLMSSAIDLGMPWSKQGAGLLDMEKFINKRPL